MDCSDSRLHGQTAGQHDVGQDPDGQEVADFAQVALPVLNRFTQSWGEKMVLSLASQGLTPPACSLGGTQSIRTSEPAGNRSSARSQNPEFSLPRDPHRISKE